MCRESTFSQSTVYDKKQHLAANRRILAPATDIRATPQRSASTRTTRAVFVTRIYDNSRISAGKFIDFNASRICVDSFSRISNVF